LHSLRHSHGENPQLCVAVANAADAAHASHDDNAAPILDETHVAPSLHAELDHIVERL
jgi:hypothetical protein